MNLDSIRRNVTDLLVPISRGTELRAKSSWNKCINIVVSYREKCLGRPNLYQLALSLSVGNSLNIAYFKTFHQNYKSQNRRTFL